MELDGSSLPRTGMTMEEIRARFGEPMLICAHGGEENWIYETAQGEMRVHFSRVVTSVFVTDDAGCADE